MTASPGPVSRRRTLVAAVALVVGAAVALVAVGLWLTRGDDEPKGPALDTIEFVEKDYDLTPDVVTIVPPGVFRFVAVNRGAVRHALVIEGEDLHAETATIAPGETASLLLELKAGMYSVYCPVDDHAAMGMRARIDVRETSIRIPTTGGG